MGKKLIITTLALFLVTAGSLTANAQRRNCDGYGPPIMSESENSERLRGMHRQYQHEMATEILGLTEEQQEQIKSIREEEKTINGALREKMQEYREQMRALTDAGTFDEDAIRTIAEEKAKIQVELVVSKARLHSKIHAIMTPEQQELAQKLRSVRKNRKGKHHRGCGPGPGMGGGQPDFD